MDRTKNALVSLVVLMWATMAWGQFPLVPGDASGTMMPDSMQQEKPLFDAIQLAGEVTDETALVQAIVKNNHAAIRDAIKGGADINAQTADGSYPFILVAIYGDTDAMQILTAYKVDVEARDKSGRNAFHYAAILGDTEKAKLLMLKNTPADRPDLDGISPLFYAYGNQHLSLADFLLAVGGANINRVDLDGDPLAFKLVVALDKPEMVQHMLDNKLNIFRRNRNDQSLAEAARRAQQQMSADLLDSEYNRTLEEFKEKLRQENAPEYEQIAPQQPEAPGGQNYHRGHHSGPIGTPQPSYNYP